MAKKINPVSRVLAGGMAISWQNVAMAMAFILMAVLSALVAKIWTDVGKIDVLEARIEALSDNKGWMKSMQREIKELQKAVWKSHPDHN